MSKLSNEEIEGFIGYSEDSAKRDIARELLSLRQLRDSAGEFDEKAAHNKALSLGYGSNDYKGHKALEEMAKWQHQQSHLAYAALKAEAEKLVEAMEPAVDYYSSTNQHELNCDPSVDFHSAECCIERELTQALTAWREKYGEKK